ncbi:PilW family protein [Natranaerofaba carboxydovora]|uniref:PilW family protein n=1 Tax=Natranaerofaba carboxydovora TaxID=2742683 RepID=UPI001F12AD11|nr:type II secretion system protein [Natranaerofaba carboxydovora]UMZ73985.1 hypothetical protein ACONDI_01555 [Natranaerofaba carboxydovora]
MGLKIINNESGLTLVELIVTLLVFAITISITSLFLSTSMGNWSRINNAADSHQSARFALFHIVDLIKEFDKEDIFITSSGSNIYLGKEGDFDYRIYNLGQNLYIRQYPASQYPFASNIKELTFSYNKVVFNENDYFLVNTSDDWNLVKIELVTGKKNISYKLQTFVQPKGF